MKKKDLMVLEDPEIVKIATESTRRKILSLLRLNDLSISQVAEILQKDQSTVYRHMKKLEAHGLVRIVGERKVHHIPEAVYGRVAEAYIIVPEIDKKEHNPIVYYKKGIVKEVMNAIKSMGYNIENERIFSRDFFRFIDALDKATAEDWKKLEKKGISMNNKTFANTALLLTLLKISENPELKDYMEEMGELVRRKK